MSQALSFENRLPDSLIAGLADFTELRIARGNYIERQKGVYTKEVVGNVKKIDETLRETAIRLGNLGKKTGHDIVNDPDLRVRAMDEAHRVVKDRHDERRRMAAMRKSAKEAREDEEDDEG